MGETKVYTVGFGGDAITTTVTSSGDAVEGWLYEVRSVHRRRLHNLVVGLDVEWRPPFGRGYNPTALLQLCVGRRCLIFQLLHADYIPDALAEFLDDPDFRFVGVGVGADAERLSNDYNLQVNNTVDLAELAADATGCEDLRNAGLKAIVSFVMGANVDKPRRVRLGPWDDYELSHEQVEYACIDAFVSFEVGRKLLTGDY
jgi:ribonuclease D